MLSTPPLSEPLTRLIVQGPVRSPRKMQSSACLEKSMLVGALASRDAAPAGSNAMVSSAFERFAGSALIGANAMGGRVGAFTDGLAADGVGPITDGLAAGEAQACVAISRAKAPTRKIASDFIGPTTAAR